MHTVCTVNMKSLSIIAKKLWPRLRLSHDKQTDRAKTICPPLAGGHKKGFKQCKWALVIKNLGKCDGQTYAHKDNGE